MNFVRNFFFPRRKLRDSKPSESMAWSNPLKEVATSRPLFMTIYATVVIGIIVSSFYVFSAVFSGQNSVSSPWLSTSVNSGGGATGESSFSFRMLVKILRFRSYAVFARLNASRLLSWQLV